MMVEFYKLEKYHNNQWIKRIGSSTCTTLSASIISLIGIVLLEKIYFRVAYWLTEREYPRTHSDFESSFAFKMFIFQFINYYSALIYLAFFKGFDLWTNPSRLWKYNDYCSPVGCTFSVLTQLLTILAGKQIMFTFVEIAVPTVKNWILTRRKDFAKARTRHERDFYLRDIGTLRLVYEYLEMIVQYGFVVMFGAVFPLAPLFALINNIAEIRVDAFKLLSARRIIPHRASDIGNWAKVLEVITRLGILTNACLVAFTTDIIDRYYYMYYENVPKPDDGSDASDVANYNLKGYMEFTMSKFDTSDWPDSMRNLTFTNVSNPNSFVETCYYRGHYEKSENGSYRMTHDGLILLLLKVGFVLLFQNLVLFLHGMIKYSIENEPEDIQLQVLRNRYVARAWLEKNSLSRQQSAKTPRPVSVTSGATIFYDCESDLDLEASPASIRRKLID